MKDLYIIVHEGEVKVEHNFGVTLSVRAYREIQEIKQTHDYRNVDGDPTKIPADLPTAKECRVHVCGSSIAVCIPQQMEALEKAGYKPRLSRSASIF